MSLRNLRREEARAYLRAAGVEERLHGRALEVTHGHPLALSLFVDVLGQRSGSDVDAERLELADAPDALRPLLERFMRDVPSRHHREALEVCAHARYTTEDLLRSALATGHAGELFGWLRTLSLVEEGALGVFPHDLAREVLDADLRWRDPESYAELHRRIRSHVLARIGHRVEGAAQADSPSGLTSVLHRAQIDVADLVFMHRRSAVLGRFVDWATLGHMYADRLRPGDRAAIQAMTERHEGAESARLVTHWLVRQPEAFIVLREAEGDTRGFVAILALHAASGPDVAADPGAAAMWQYAQHHGAPRPGEEVFAERFLIDRDDYQGPASMNAMALVHPLHLLCHPHAVWDFIGPWGSGEPIEPLMAYIDFFRAPEADYDVGGRAYCVFGHDWRRVGVDTWLDRLTARELAEGDGLVAPHEPAAVPGLARAELADAARQALRDLHRPDALARNPLMRSRAVTDRSDSRPSSEALRDLIAEAIDSLRVDPRDEKLRRALARTFVRPAQTQELAADALGLPFSTYRRHLTRGVERVTAWLWERELYGPVA